MEIINLSPNLRHLSTFYIKPPQERVHNNYWEEQKGGKWNNYIRPSQAYRMSYTVCLVFHFYNPLCSFGYLTKPGSIVLMLLLCLWSYTALMEQQNQVGANHKLSRLMRTRTWHFTFTIVIIIKFCQFLLIIIHLFVPWTFVWIKSKILIYVNFGSNSNT